MSLAAMRVPTVFTAQDKFSSVINTMTKNTNTFASGVGRLNNRINNEMTSMTRVAKYAAVGVGASLFYKASQDVIDYEVKINSLAAVTGTVVGAMNKQIEDLGRKTSRSVIDIAGSFEIVGSKMSQYLDKPVALQRITNASILMSEAARMELEPAIDSLTGVMNIYGKSAEDAMHIVNKLSAGEIVGSISIAETADLLRQFGGTARLANVNVEESVALVQALTKSLGVEGVGRGIRNLMVDLNMVGAFDKNKTRALEKAGVNMDVLGDKTLDLVTRLTELKKLEGNSAAMGLFFKKTGIQTGATLFQNFDDLKRFLALIQETNQAQEQANKNNATFATLWARTKDAFTNYIVVQDKTNTGLELMKSLLSWVKDNMGAIINLIGAVVVAFIGWKVIVGIVSLVSGVMSAFTAIMSVHRFVVLWATLTNTGYATSLLAVASAAWLAYWPALLILGALGALVYAFWDTGNAADDMVSKQVAALSKGDAAMINSTDVMARELDKQKKLMEVPKIVNPSSKEAIKMNKILSEESNRKALSAAFGSDKDMSGNQILPKINQSIAKKFYENKQMEGVLGKDKATTLRNQGFTFEEFKKVYPNVAGYENRPNQENKGEITITFKGDTSNVSDVQGSGGFVFKGIPAKTDSTMGVPK